MWTVEGSRAAAEHRSASARLQRLMNAHAWLTRSSLFTQEWNIQTAEVQSPLAE